MYLQPAWDNDGTVSITLEVCEAEVVGTFTVP
jgi:hypothetical protein